MSYYSRIKARSCNLRLIEISPGNLYICSVKFLCLLLSLCVVLLSARPCCADNDCRENTSTVKKEQAGKNSSQEKTCPGCSPFFSCGSCAGFVVTKPVTHNLRL